MDDILIEHLTRFAKYIRKFAQETPSFHEPPRACVYPHNAEDIEAMLDKYRRVAQERDEAQARLAVVEKELVEARKVVGMDTFGIPEGELPKQIEAQRNIFRWRMSTLQDQVLMLQDLVFTNKSDLELDAGDIARRIRSLVDLTMVSSSSDFERIMNKTDYYWALAHSKDLEQDVDVILQALSEKEMREAINQAAREQS